jgi:hypothetical protein
MTISNIKIIDNFLPLSDFEEIKQEMLSPYFPWFLNLYVARQNENIDFEDSLYNYQLIHSFYKNWRPDSNYIHLIDKLIQKINPAAILRIKANLNPVTEHQIIHGMHKDFPISCTTGIYYINTNNGITVFEDGTAVKSIENRFVSFNSQLMHSGSTCTDQKARVVININYIEGVPNE